MTYEEAAAKFRLVPITIWRIEYRESPDELDTFDIIDSDEVAAKEELERHIQRHLDHNNLTFEELMAKDKLRNTN